MVLVCIVFIYMPAWYIPFCGTVLGEGNEKTKTSYSFEELKAVTRYAVEGINSAAERIVINPDGTVDFPDKNEARVLITEAMHGISDRYPRLTGYYPLVKTALCSDILERMSIGGYNYPLQWNRPKTNTMVLCVHIVSKHMNTAITKDMKRKMKRIS